MRKFCKHYVGEFCTSGGCPIDNKEELEEYGAPVPHSCRDCHYNKQCRNCIFFATPYCIDELLDRVSRIIAKHKKEGRKNTISCSECKYLTFSDCYGECSRGYRGIVNHDDSCPYGESKNEKGE